VDLAHRGEKFAAFGGQSVKWEGNTGVGHKSNSTRVKMLEETLAGCFAKHMVTLATRRIQRELMTSFSLIFKSTVCFGSFVLLTGCLSGRPGIAIVNIETGQQYVRTVTGNFLETPIDVDETTKSFRTLHRTGPKTIVLQTVDFNGQTMAAKTLPIFDYCLVGYGSTREYAISRDGERIVYFDGKARELRVYEFSTGSCQVLETNFTTLTTSSVFIEMFRISDEWLLVSAHSPEAEKDNILLVNARQGNSEQIAQPREVKQFDNALSHSKRYLAYWEGFKRPGFLDGQFIIYDLIARKQVATIKSMSGGWLSQPQWSLNDEYLAYVEKGSRIMLYSVTADSSRLIGQAANNESVSLYGFGNGLLFYKRYDWKKRGCMEEPLRGLDVSDGSERQIPGIRINGPVFFVDNGTKLIAKVGF
jgi:hypothetical protein